MNGFKVIHHKHFWQSLCLLLIDIVFFTRTDASKVAPLVLIVGFILSVLTCYELLYGVLSVARLYGLPVRYKQRLAVYLTGVVGLILALQSIGELTPRDVLVLLPLATLAYIYGVYATSRRHNLDT
jgi:hypothetical protein